MKNIIIVYWFVLLCGCSDQCETLAAIYSENRTDTVTKYYSDGTRSIEYVTVNDTLDGSWRLYYESGTLKEEVHYKKGFPAGSWSYFYENESLKAKGKVKKHIKEKSIEYHIDRNGDSIITERIYEKPFKEGVWMYWDVSEELIKVELFEENVIIDSLIGFSSLTSNDKLDAIEGYWKYESVIGTNNNNLSLNQTMNFDESGFVTISDSIGNNSRIARWSYSKLKKSVSLFNSSNNHIGDLEEVEISKSSLSYKVMIDKEFVQITMIRELR